MTREDGPLEKAIAQIARSVLTEAATDPDTPMHKRMEARMHLAIMDAMHNWIESEMVPGNDVRDLLTAVAFGTAGIIWSCLGTILDRIQADQAAAKDIVDVSLAAFHKSVIESAIDDGLYPSETNGQDGQAS